MKILVIDIGNNVKIYAAGHLKGVKVPSDPKFTPPQMLMVLRQVTKGWKYSAVSMGYPGAALQGKLLHEPAHLGPGWVGFDFEKAARKRLGENKWMKAVHDVVAKLKNALEADYIVLGGGNA